MLHFFNVKSLVFYKKKKGGGGLFICPHTTNYSCRDINENTENVLVDI